jgi:hypothetical protein
MYIPVVGLVVAAVVAEVVVEVGVAAVAVEEELAEA